MMVIAKKSALVCFVLWIYYHLLIYSYDWLIYRYLCAKTASLPPRQMYNGAVYLRYTWKVWSESSLPRHKKTYHNGDSVDRKWQDYIYIQCEYKSTWQKIKHLLREENKVKENKIP